MSIKLEDKYESDAPTEHNRIETQIWEMDCIWGYCDHAHDDDMEQPSKECPFSVVSVCEQCTDWLEEYESGIEAWPCVNQAVQEWQAAGGEDRQYDTVVDAFLRGWNERQNRTR